MAAGVGALEWVGLLVVATTSVVLFGGVEERVLAPLEVLLFAIALVVVVRRYRLGLPVLRLHPAAAPILVVCAIGALQLLPLPAAVVALVSPGMASVRDGVPAASATLALSVYPYATQLAVLRLAAYATFFALVLEALSTPGRVRTALVWAATLGTAVAAYGLFNHLAGNTRLLWVPRRFYLDSATGTFVNRNHFAALMVLLLPTVLACYRMRAPRSAPARTPAPGEAVARGSFFALCGATMCLAVLFSKSRGGIVCGAVMLGGLWLVLHRHAPRRRWRDIVLPLAWIGVAGGWAAYIGTTEVLQRFAGLGEGLRSGAGRIAQWIDTAHIVGDFPVLGSGLGTYEFLFPMYKTIPAQVEFAHAHNDYLQLCAEAGLIGLLVCAWAIVRVGRRAVAAPRPAPAVTMMVWPLAAGIGGMLLHSAIDFGLQVPGNVFCLLAVAAVAIRIAEDPGLIGAPAPGAPAPGRAPRPAALSPGHPSDSRTTA